MSDKRRRGEILAVLLALCLGAGVALGITVSVTTRTDKATVREHAGTAAKRRGSSEKSAPESTAPPPVNFDVDRATTHVTQLAGVIGAREEGTSGESAAAGYVRRQMESYGYVTVEQEVPVTTTNRTSHNVIAKLEGTKSPARVIVVGAHLDSKGGPGANDNATGCAVLLELARVLKNNSKQVPTIEFVFFGGEEIAQGGGTNDHHWGSRYFVKTLSPADRAAIAGMISIDMAGAGPEFRVRNMGLAPQAVRDFLLELGRDRGLSYTQDASSIGYSDHEPFERAGIPSAWLEFRDFPQYHQPGDTVESVDFAHVQTAGSFMQEFFEHYLTPERLQLIPQHP